MAHKKMPSYIVNGVINNQKKRPKLIDLVLSLFIYEFIIGLEIERLNINFRFQFFKILFSL